MKKRHGNLKSEKFQVLVFVSIKNWSLGGVGGGVAVVVVVVVVRVLQQIELASVRFNVCVNIPVIDNFINLKKKFSKINSLFKVARVILKLLNRSDLKVQINEYVKKNNALFNRVTLSLYDVCIKIMK